jgi:small-conductance mechanosensitive channel
VRELLLAAYHEHEAILDAPATSVSFKDLTSSGMVIGVSGMWLGRGRYRAPAATCCSPFWAVA